MVGALRIVGDAGQPSRSMLLVRTGTKLQVEKCMSNRVFVTERQRHLQMLAPSNMTFPARWSLKLIKRAMVPNKTTATRTHIINWGIVERSA
jgi:hypothetical protein